MNLILLFDEDFVAPGRVRLSGRRLAHIRGVHRAKVGDRLRVGRLNGLCGESRILRLDERGVELETQLERAPPSRPALTLVMGLPRPKMLKRCLRMTAEMGVDRLYLVNAARVEKSFWQSPCLQPAKVRECLILGLEQACDTRLPEVCLRRRFKPFVEDELAELIENRRALLADPSGEPLERISSALPPHGSTLLCIGPEGGFVPYEVEKLCAAGCRSFSLGTRIYRVETALPLLVGRLLIR